MTAIAESPPFPAELIDAVADRPDDWCRWWIIADWYADRGDEVGESWAKWVEAKRRLPWCRNAKQFDWRDWHYIENIPNMLHRCDDILHVLDKKMRTLASCEWGFGSATITRAYEFLLEGWRLLTPDQRAECWRWNP